MKSLLYLPVHQGLLHLYGLHMELSATTMQSNKNGNKITQVVTMVSYF
jgi:hypothetical protein